MNTNEIIDLIKAAGFKVFVGPIIAKRPEKITACHYTDGVNIGYAQWGSLSVHSKVYTVHKPDRQIGDGFLFLAQINIYSIQGAAKCIAPAWATDQDRQRVVKWQTWDQFWNSKGTGRSYVEI